MATHKPRHPEAGARTCEHCGAEPATRLFFRVVIRTCGHDASKRTSSICGNCSAAGRKWMEHIGLEVAEEIGAGQWDVLVEPLERAAD